MENCTMSQSGEARDASAGIVPTCKQDGKGVLKQQPMKTMDN